MCINYKESEEFFALNLFWLSNSAFLTQREGSVFIEVYTGLVTTMQNFRNIQGVSKKCLFGINRLFFDNTVKILQEIYIINLHFRLIWHFYVFFPKKNCYNFFGTPCMFLWKSHQGIRTNLKHKKNTDPSLCVQINESVISHYFGTPCTFFWNTLQWCRIQTKHMENSTCNVRK